MTFPNITKDINNGKYSPIYLFHGEESYFIDKLSKALEMKVLNESEKAFNMSILYGKDVDHKDVVDHARQYPMMASHRLVIIHEAQDMRSIKDLDTYTANPSPTTVLVINYKHKKVDQRNKWVKNIKKTGVIFESKKLYDNKVAPWIRSYIDEKGYSTDNESTHILAELLGSDLQKIVNEVDKLLLNIEKGSKVTKEDVMEQVGMSKDFNVFELQSVISKRDTAKAFQISKYFNDNPKNNPIQAITGSLYNYFTKVYIASYHRNKSDRELQSLLGLGNMYFLGEYKTAARNYPPDKLRKVFSWLKDADKKSKGVDARNEDTKSILDTFLLRLFYE